MKDLRRLIKLIKKKGQRSIQLVNNNFRKNETSKDNLLYEGIINNRFTNDEDAAQTIFEADPGNRNYRNAKGKLRYKLLNHLYFLDYDKESYTQYQKSEYACLHTLHQCKILINENNADLAVKLLPQLIKTAEELEFVHIAVEALTMLRDQYAKKGKITPFNETNESLIKQRKFQQVFQDCRDLYNMTIVHINKSISAQNRVVDKVPEAIQSISKEAQKHKSKSLHVLAGKLELVYNSMQWNFDKNIKLCTELEKKYLSRGNDEVVVDLDRHEIAFTHLKSYLYKGEVKEGGQYAKNQIKLFKPSSRHWFRFAEYYFLLLMKGEQYEEAATLFRTVRTNKNYNALPESVRNRWYIYRAYLIFFNDSKILRWGYNIEEFISTKPAYPKEYAGLNVATLAIQFLFLLREGYIEEIKACVAEIQHYKSAHLDKRHNYRNSIFIRMLEIVVEKEFDVERIQEKGNNYYKKLLKHRIPSDINQDAEVIPYEKMWEHILNIIKSNKSYVHFRFYNVKAI